MRFGVPRRLHPVVVRVEAIVELRAQADEKPEVEKEHARKRLEELEARAQRAGVLQGYRNGDAALTRRAGDE